MRERGRYNKREKNIVETSGNSAQTVQKRKPRVDATSVGNRERNRNEQDVDVDVQSVQGLRVFTEKENKKKI